MRTLRQFLYMVLLLGLAGSMIGCIGGGSSTADMDQVHQLLDSYETAIIEQDMEVVSLYTDPAYWDGEEVDEAQMLLAYALVFWAIEEVHLFELTDRDVTFNADKTEAGVEADTKLIVTTIETDNQESETVVTEGELQMTLRNVQGQWLIRATSGTTFEDD